MLLVGDGMKTRTETMKDEARTAFLRRPPLERAELMHHVITGIIGMLAKGEGVAEYEVYKRYLRNNPRHYQRASR